MMETGTGKTYTYTKTMFELNRRFGIFKFIIIVPTLSIKAGTISFLNSVGIRQHFKEEYGKIIELYLLESQKKPSKQRTPMVVGNFVKAESFAKQFFGNAVEIHFRTQWENQYIRKIIDEIQPINTNYSR